MRPTLRRPHVYHVYLDVEDISMCLERMVRDGAFCCVGLLHTVQLTKPSIVAEFGWWDSSPIVFYGTVSS